MSNDLKQVNKEIIDNTVIVNEETPAKDTETVKIPEIETEKVENPINLKEKTQTEENLDDNTNEADTDVPDVVKQAEEVNKALKEELEALKSRTSNVFEENEALKIELEEQKKLDGLAKENAEIKAKLEAIKRSTLVDGMIATGKINENLREWADNLSYEQLEEFSKHAPKVKTILDQKNPSTLSDEDMEKWKKEQQKSRIL